MRSYCSSYDIVYCFIMNFTETIPEVISFSTVHFWVIVVASSMQRSAYAIFPQVS